MSICPSRPDTNRRCFTPCPIGSFCECEGVIVGHIFGINILENPTVPVGMMIATLPAKAMSAGTAETRSGSGRQPASAVGNADLPEKDPHHGR